VPASGLGADPSDQTALRLDLEAALAALPPEQRVPLVLVDMEGYPVAEVAAMLGLPVGTVKSRCARARARLAPIVAPGRREFLGRNRTAEPDVPPSRDETTRR
jgi:RNA polymerase sigma-70 factor (ECF subfamily)